MGAGMSPAQARGNKTPGVMQQNRMESRVEINHPWRQGREEEEVCCSQASPSNKASETPGGQQELGQDLSVAPAVPEWSRSWPGAPLLQLSWELVFPIPSQLLRLHLVAGNAQSCQE